VRGLYGEGSRASGDLYQISNQVTLGKSEQAILKDIRDVIAMILQYERQARQSLIRDRKQAEHDRVARSLGVLASAKMITAEETMEYLSTVRLGVHLNLIHDVSSKTLNELFIQSQAAHLQKITGQPLDGEERNAARAQFLRQRLKELSGNR
jgi:protein arginine kinase